MQATPYLLTDYFNGEKQCVIPLFQRPYRWSERNWKALWNDIISKYKETGLNRHFLGTIVSLPVTTIPVGVTKHLIIDGQQRLTTLAVLLRALKDASSPADAGRIEDLLINRHSSGAEHLKLLPTQADREAFNRLLSDPSPPTATHPLINCYTYFKQMLSKKDDNGAAFAPATLFEVIRTRLHVVSIGLDPDDDPYEIFESLNYKGEPLTQADLIRNHVMMRFRHGIEPGGEQEMVYKRYWQPIEEMFGDGLTNFLRHYCMKENGVEVKETGVYVAAKLRFNAANTPRLVQDELGRLLTDAKHYSCFLDPSNEARPEVARRLRALARVDVSTSYPLLLKIFGTVDKGSANETVLEQALEIIESFMFRRMICGVPSNSLGRIFVQLARDLPGEGFVEWLRKTLSRGSDNRRWPTDEELRKACKYDKQYGRKSTSAVLCRLEESYNRKEPVAADTLSVEHIMPQTLNRDWKDMLGAEWKQIHEQWADALANLTLTGYNSEMGNGSWVEKQRFYERSNLMMTRQLAKHVMWSAEQLKERTEELSSQLINLYPRPQTQAENQDAPF